MRRPPPTAASPLHPNSKRHDNAPYRVRWQDWTGWCERRQGGKRRRKPPMQHRDFIDRRDADTFARQLRATRGPDCLVAVLSVPTNPAL